MYILAPHPILNHYFGASLEYTRNRKRCIYLWVILYSKDSMRMLRHHVVDHLT